MDIYDRLGVQKVINAQGLVTRLGGSLMPAEAYEAMLTEFVENVLALRSPELPESADVDSNPGSP